jgi:RHS repeat-associated protein
MRHLLLAAMLAVAPSLLAEDVPQAVAALAHLKPRTDVGPSGWTAGPYQYDGAGNITAVGSEAYVYDKVGRLTSATLRGPDLSALQTQTFGYDVYGNLTSTSKLGQTVLLPTTAGTNHLETLGYDASGNLITAGTLRYAYDAVGMLNTVHAGTTAQPRIIYAYTADDERLFAFDVSTGTTHWTLRGLDNKVLRDFKQTGPTWSVERDYVYRDGLLLAALKPGGAAEHYTLDHLGTPRLITDASGHKVGYHVYWPFGEEWSPGTAQEGAPLKFTGHERDADPTGGTAPLDYMHARYYAAGWGRFGAVDPGKDWDATRPQSWNLYTYVRNNPLNATDPTGRQQSVEAMLDRQTREHLESGEPTYWMNPTLQQAGFIVFQGMVAFSVGQIFDVTAPVPIAVKAPSGPTEAPLPGAPKISPDFVVTPHGEAIPVPKGATGPNPPLRGSGMSYQGGSGGPGMDPKTTGVRIMDANVNQGSRVNYMNEQGQTVNPVTGRTIPRTDPAGHIPLKPSSPPP